MNALKHAWRSSVDAWKAPDDDELVDSAAMMALTSRAIVLYGDAGAGQDDIARSVAHRLVTNRGPIELSWPPVRVRSEILGGFADSPPSHTPVILIPDIATFSGPDLDLVAGLVIRGDAIVIAAGIGKENASLSPLAQLIRLEPVRVGELHQHSAANFLESGLGGPVSDEAAGQICEAGAGNRARMRMIVKDWLDSSFLVRHSGVWVICGHVPPAGPRLVRQWQDRLALLDDDVREVFEVLALAGEIPLNLLQQVCSPTAVDTVYDSGYLSISSRQARLRGGVNREAIASRVAPGRSRDLLDRVCAQAQDNSDHSRFVTWRKRCGMEVAEDDLLDAAERLLVEGRFGEATELLPPAPKDADRVRSLRLGAYLSQRRLLHLPGDGRGGDTVLEVAEARGSSRAIEFLVTAWRGNFRPLLESRGREPRLPRGLEWMWQQMTHEALVMSGRVAEGLNADRDLVRTLESSELSPALIQRARLEHFDIEVLAGEWTRAAATLAGGWDGERVQGIEGVVYRALSCVLTGSFDECVQMLRREIPQMRVMDRHDLLPVASAMLAVSLAAIGRRAEAREALAGMTPENSSEAEIWRVAWATSYFSAQALGLIGRVREAVELLMDFADRDREQDNHAQELLTLSAALQWGYGPALDRLEYVAERTDSRFARACLAVVQGLRAGDAGLLEEGAMIAREIGQYRFADFARSRAKHMTRVGGVPEKFERHSTSATALTRRQRQIVECVLGGQTNAAIANSIGISVRTVESHLYNVYTKLNVSNRADLRAVLSGIRPASRAFPRTT